MFSGGGSIAWGNLSVQIQENGAAVIANVCSIDLGAKRQAHVLAHSGAADTQV